MTFEQKQNWFVSIRIQNSLSFGNLEIFINAILDKEPAKYSNNILLLPQPALLSLAIECRPLGALKQI